jgi:energy-coupling factor transport system substrate-specific component
MWKLRDIILTVILSVVCGVIYMGWDWFTGWATAAWSPAALGIVNGVWWIASVLVAYIVRRPGAALFAGVASAFFEFAFGSPYGISAVYSGLLQGGGTEIGLLLFAWKRYDTGVLAFAAAVGGLGNTVQWFFQYGGSGYSHAVQLGYLVLTLVSGAVFAGLLPKWIGDRLNRAGSVRNFELGRQTRQVVHD